MKNKIKTMVHEKDCAFQYVQMSGQIFKDTKIVCDETELTLEQAKELWNKYFPDCAKNIKRGGTCEMVIWINMQTPQDYRDSLQYISNAAQSDGISIWETKKIYFTKEFKV